VDPVGALGDAIGRSKAVLLVGMPGPSLVDQLRANDCELVAIVFAIADSTTVSSYCSLVEIVDPNSWTIPESVSPLSFDTIVFDRALEIVPEPASLLAGVAPLLKHDGFVAATIPYTAHGAIRLALMQDSLSNPYLGVASAGEATEMFERSGYIVKEVRRALSPIFGPPSDLPSLVRSDFSESAVREIEADFESETAAFWIVATLHEEFAIVRDGGGSESSPQEREAQEVAIMERDDEYVVQFETEFEAQRRQTQLEHELQAAARELDRARGRVIALGAQFCENVSKLTEQLAGKDTELSQLRHELSCVRERSSKKRNTE
jgi:hypothetical protein